MTIPFLLFVAFPTVRQSLSLAPSIKQGVPLHGLILTTVLISEDGGDKNDDFDNNEAHVFVLCPVRLFLKPSQPCRLCGIMLNTSKHMWFISEEDGEKMEANEQRSAEIGLFREAEITAV